RGGELSVFYGKDVEVIGRALVGECGQRGDAVGIGGCGGERVLADATLDRGAGDGRAGVAVDDEGDDSFVRRARDERNVGDDHDGVGLQVAVRCFEQIQSGREFLYRQNVVVGEEGWRRELSPARDELRAVEQRHL